MSMVKVNHALNHHWCETSLATTSRFLKHQCGVQRFHCQEVPVWGQFYQSHAGHIEIVLRVSESTEVTYFQLCFPGRDLLIVIASVKHLKSLVSHSQILFPFNYKSKTGLATRDYEVSIHQNFPSQIFALYSLVWLTQMDHINNESKWRLYLGDFAWKAYGKVGV